LRASSDDGHAFGLLSALVRGARIAALPQTATELVTGLMADGEDLSARVDWLLRNTLTAGSNRQSIVCTAGVSLFTGVVITAMLQPITLSAVHGMLESFIR
jgi:hypothetical protein